MKERQKRLEKLFDDYCYLITRTVGRVQVYNEKQEFLNSMKELDKADVYKSKLSKIQTIMFG